MATSQDVSREIAALRDLITQDQQSDQQVVDQLSGTITDLKAQLDGLRSSMTDEQSTTFDTIIAQLNDVKTTIRAVSTTSRGGGLSETDVTGTATNDSTINES